VIEDGSATRCAMRAARWHAPAGSEALKLDEVERPRPGEGEVLVRVCAAAVTRDELEWPVDRLPAVPSYELSGVVVSVGAGVEDVPLGGAVYGLLPFDRDGAAAEFVVAAASVLAPKPSSLSHLESAALPLAGLSAWQGLFDHGRLEGGQRVLVTGAAGGVGHLAVQLARSRGAHVTATASTRDLDYVRGLGASEVFDSAAGLERLLERVDLVFDTVGGEVLARASGLLRQGGRVVSVAEQPPGAGDGVYFVVEPNREQLIELARLVEAGDVHPEVDSVFPLEDVRAAFERCGARGKRGKVVLRVADE
jgi:NADPH:quinone reductase-like Zn-dependent oxidoreductase